MKTLLVQGATLGYGGNTLFSNLNLGLEAGEVLCLSGHSGCGKTSLLRAILGFTPLHAGSVEVCEQQLAPDTAESIRRNTAYLPQDLHLTVRTVEELLDATLSLRHLARHHARLMEKAWKHCEALGLQPEQIISLEAAKLSGGQRQRILLAAALASPAPLLLLDEPTSALDAHNAELAAECIRQVCREEQRAALVVSHDTALFQPCISL